MQNKITQEQAAIFNEWQQETGKQPIYGAIDIQQLDFFTQNLNDADVYDAQKAQKISFDFLLLLSEYLNRAQICEISDIVDVNEFSQVALKMFDRFKPKIDFGFINFQNANNRGDTLTAQREEKRGKVKAPESIEQIDEFCINNGLTIDTNEIRRFWAKNSRNRFANIKNWQAYLLSIGKEQQARDRARQLNDFANRVIRDHNRESDSDTADLKL